MEELASRNKRNQDLEALETGALPMAVDAAALEPSAGSFFASDRAQVEQSAVVLCQACASKSVISQFPLLHLHRLGEGGRER